MRVRYGWSILAAAALMAVVSPAHSGGPAPQGAPTNTWIILGNLKGKKGFQISGGTLETIRTGPPVAGVAPADSADNPNNGAAGTVIVGAADGGHCKCTHHYHGTLYGFPDPAPSGCGWGCAIPAGEATQQIRDLAEAYELANAALNILLDNQGGLSGGESQQVQDLLEDCVTKLNAVIPAGVLTAAARKKNKLLTTVQHAISTVNDTAIELEVGNPPDLVFAILNLDNGISLHREVLKHLKPKIPKS
jgi:hypothetical protein